MIKQLRDPLAPPVLGMLAQHLELCPACRLERTAMTADAARLRQGGRPPTPTASGVRPSREVLLRRCTQQNRWARARAAVRALAALPRWTWSGPLVAGVLAAAVLISMRFAGGPPPTPLVAGNYRPTHPTPSVPPAGPARPTGPRRSWANDPLVAPPVKLDRPVRSAPKPDALPRIPIDPAARPGHAAGAQPAPPLPDPDYLDGRDPALTATWMAGNARDQQVLAWLHRLLPPVRDDFVQVPLPRLASTDLKSAAVGAAIREYEKEANVVDARLFKKVTLQLKATSLEEFCAELERQAGVRFRASRGAQDEKVTVFVKERPVRDVMREVARLFGYYWARSGEEGTYRYELIQDLRSQLAEEEMRDRDLRAALVALDEQMAAYQPFLGLTPEQLRARAAQSGGAEQALLGRVAGPLWGGMQLYQRLTPAERAGLINGVPLRFRSAAQDANHQLPAEWEQPLSGLFQNTRFAPPTQPEPPRAFSITGLEVNLQINRTELGQLSLETETIATVRGEGAPGPAIGFPGVLATTASPSVARPDNANQNAALKKDPRFQRTISLRPTASCPRVGAAEEARRRGEPAPSLQELVIRYLETGRALPPERQARLAQFMTPHVGSADVWQAVHEQTGMPIVADAYSRAYPTASVTVEKASLFDALCRATDEMRVRWQLDGDFLLGRSTSFFWDKVKEVPNRLLCHWSADRDRLGGLPVGALLEMGQLSDQQLDSQVVGGVVTHCWGLPEWDLLQKPGGWFSARPWLRLLAALPPAQVRQAADPAGLPVKDLTPEAQRAVLGLMEHFPVVDLAPSSVAGWRIRFAYAPAGGYIWAPAVAAGRTPLDMDRLPLISAGTAREALAKAHQRDPNVRPEEITQSEGVFYVTLLLANGMAHRVAGERPMRLEIHSSGAP
jgi:hypothetical protein